MTQPHWLTVARRWHQHLRVMSDDSIKAQNREKHSPYWIKKEKRLDSQSMQRDAVILATTYAEHYELIYNAIANEKSRLPDPPHPLLFGSILAVVSQGVLYTFDTMECYLYASKCMAIWNLPKRMKGDRELQDMMMQVQALSLQMFQQLGSDGHLKETIATMRRNNTLIKNMCKLIHKHPKYRFRWTGNDPHGVIEDGEYRWDKQ